MRWIVITTGVIVCAAAGCQDPLKEYAECKKIEFARCELRQDCQNDPDNVLSNTDQAAFNKEFKGFDYDTCIAYAKEHCRTRKIGGGEEELRELEGYGNWSGTDVKDCATAIKALYPAGCVKLDKSEDETEENKFPEVFDTCWFINEDKDDDEEPEDAGTGDTDTGDSLDGGADAG